MTDRGGTTSPTPVTIVVRRRVRPERVADYEAWQAGILAEASKFPGHLGAEVLRPANPALQDYVLIFRFDSEENLRRWEESPVRAEWLAKVTEFSTGTPTVEKVTGMEYWFKLPYDAGRRPPPRWKMAVVTVIALWPLILFVVPLLARLFGFLPRPVASLGSTIVMVGLMTFLVMPALTRMFARWLFPADAPPGPVRG